MRAMNYCRQHGIHDCDCCATLDRLDPIQPAPNYPGRNLILELTAENEKLRAALGECVDGLEKCAKPSTWHAPCITCGEKIASAGNYIARDTLAKVREMVKL